MPKDNTIKKVLVIGSGPIVIGQAAEFDYAGAQACRVLMEEGITTVLVNSNPATIMTDKKLADAIYLDEKELMTEDEALLAYEFTFLLIAVIAFIYLRFVKRERFNVIKEHDKFFAAAFETAGQYFYVFAMSGNSSVAAPMISSYCVFSVVLSRLFLKEKLTFKQYMAILTVITGIVLIGIADEA